MIISALLPLFGIGLVAAMMGAEEELDELSSPSSDAPEPEDLGTDGLEQILGSVESDILQGTEGSDDIRGFEGSDIATAGAGDDLVIGAEGDDSLQGNEGDDTLWGGVGDDLLTGSAGTDVLRGDEGDDVLRGGAEGDFLEGGDGDDALIGEAGNDTLITGEGNDNAVGGSGEDSIIAGANDIVTGGEDGDLFQVLSDEEAGAVTVTDFDPSEDQILLTGTDGTALQFEEDDTRLEVSQAENGTDTQVLFDGALLAVLQNSDAASLAEDTTWLANFDLADDMAATSTNEEVLTQVFVSTSTTPVAGEEGQVADEGITQSDDPSADATDTLTEDESASHEVGETSAEENATDPEQTAAEDDVEGAEGTDTFDDTNAGEEAETDIQDESEEAGDQAADPEIFDEGEATDKNDVHDDESCTTDDAEVATDDVDKGAIDVSKDPEKSEGPEVVGEETAELFQVAGYQVAESGPVVIDNFDPDEDVLVLTDLKGGEIELNDVSFLDLRASENGSDAELLFKDTVVAVLSDTDPELLAEDFLWIGNFPSSVVPPEDQTQVA